MPHLGQQLTTISHSNVNQRTFIISNSIAVGYFNRQEFQYKWNFMNLIKDANKIETQANYLWRNVIMPKNGTNGIYLKNTSSGEYPIYFTHKVEYKVNITVETVVQRYHLIQEVQSK